MKLIFDDGTIQNSLATTQWQIVTGEVLVRPQRIPQYLKIVWMDPPTYADLAFVACDAIQPGDCVMTSKGLKRVANVER